MHVSLNLGDVFVSRCEGLLKAKKRFYLDNSELGDPDGVHAWCPCMVCMHVVDGGVFGRGCLWIWVRRIFCVGGHGM